MSYESEGKEEREARAGHPRRGGQLCSQKPRTRSITLATQVFHTYMAHQLGLSKTLGSLSLKSSERESCWPEFRLTRIIGGDPVAKQSN